MTRSGATALTEADGPPEVRDYAPAIDATIDATAYGLLLWTRIGRLRVESAGSSIPLTAGEALWVPPARSIRVVSAPGTVVVPVLATRDAVSVAPSAPTPIAVERSWQPALLDAFAHSLGYLVPPSDGTGRLVRFLRAASAGFPLPPFPVSAEALAVAHSLLAPQRLPPDASLGELIRATGAGERMVERQFRSETGLSVRSWRAGARLASAARALADGTRPAGAAEAAGFRSSSSFARAFRQATGQTPGAYARGFGTDDRPAPPAPPPLPASRSLERVNGFDVAVWAARGTGSVEVASTVVRLRTSEVVILPAGLPNRIMADDDSILLPVASGAPDPVRPGGVRVAPVSGRLRTVLLHASVSSYTGIRPPGFDASELLDGIRSLATTERVDASARPAHIARSRRLTEACNLLRAGASVRATSERVGYAHPSSFARAFATAFGETPADFRRRSLDVGSATVMTWAQRNRPPARSPLRP